MAGCGSEVEAGPGGSEADAEAENEGLRQQFRKALEEVKRILDRIDLSDTIGEVSNVLDSVKELEAMIEAAGTCQDDVDLAAAKLDIEERVQQAWEMATKMIPTAVAAISRAKSPNTSEQATHALRNMETFKARSEVLGVPLANLVQPKEKGKGHRKHSRQDAATAQRRFSREELRQRLRSNAFGWTQLPAPQTEKPDPKSPECPECPESPRKLNERSRKSWLKWWSHEEDGSGLDLCEAFFRTLPPEKLTLVEMELRDAIIDYLEQRQRGKEEPTWDEIRVQPTVVECTKKALPHYVSLEEWLRRRQRLSNGAIVPWPAPPPVWHLDPVQRWKKDPPNTPPEPAISKFQRRDSTQRRGSSVFGVNFEVTEHGQIFGALADDDESLRELPWPCSSVVPEQKSFEWIKGKNHAGHLPSVASHRNMTVEDVMAWRLSHRFRQRKVEPVLQSMWQTLSKRRVPKDCKCDSD